MSGTKKQTEGVKESRFFLFEWVIELRKRYGILNILTSGMLMIFMSLTLLISFNPSIIFDRYMEYEEKKHTESFNYRMKYQKTVLRTLNDLMKETKAHRAFVIEFHNGKVNTTGLSFNFGSLTYEVLKDSVESIREDYAEFSLERFHLHLYLYDHNFWCGSTKDLANIDTKLYKRMEANGTYGIAITTIYGIKNEIGFLAVTFDDSKESYDSVELGNILRKYASELAPFLDGENAK